MNVVQKVTLQTLKKNRRRTVVTIFGTAVAVAMVTALAVLAASFLDMTRRGAIESSGEWHIQFYSVDERALPILEQHSNVKNVIASLPQGFLQLPGRENKTRSTLALQAYTKNSYPDLPVQVIEGRLPEKQGEILLSDTFMETAGISWKVGETVQLEQGYYRETFVDEEGNTHEIDLYSANDPVRQTQWMSQGQQTYTVVGYAQVGRLEQGWQDSFTALTVYEPSAVHDALRLTNAQVLLEKVDYGIYNLGKGMADQLQQLYSAEDPEGEYEYSASYNTMLLAGHGITLTNAVSEPLYLFLGILLLIVVVGSVSLINNAFSISLNERVRVLGMLAGVGATRRQKRQSVFFEALLIGIFAIPVGILAGLVGIGITLRLLGEAIGSIMGEGVFMVMVVPWWCLLFTVVFSAFVLLLSAFMPALRASRIAPVEAMRSGGAEKIRKTHPSRLARRLFGVEAELGIKNSKRSRKRYHAILSSLVISVVLFLSVSAAMQYLRAGVVMGGSNSTYKVQVSFWQQANEEDLGYPRPAEEIAAIRALPDAGTVEVFQVIEGAASLPPEQVSESLMARMDEEDTFSGEPLSEAIPFAVIVYALDDESFTRYCKRAGIDMFPQNNAEQLPVILLKDMVYQKPNGTLETITPSTLKAGEKLSMEMSLLPLQEEAQEESIKQQGLYIDAVSNVYPEFASGRFFSANTLPVIVHMESMEAYFEQQGLQPSPWNGNYSVFSDTENPAAFYESVEKMETPEGFFRVAYDLDASRRQDQISMVVMAVFTYGFVALITLVCAANIFNTVSTGILLRAREFAVLRSMGLTPAGFNKMMDCETIFYGVKALLIGVPISVALSVLLYHVISGGFQFGFSLPWGAYIVAVAGVFLLVGSSMVYARRRVRGLNIVETLKNENQ